jgi:hypothetical protein
MSTLATETLTLLDYSKRLAPDGAVETDIVETLSQTNDILTDMLWMQGNLENGHRVTMRTGLPTGTWRKLNQGVASSKSTTAQVDEACGKYFQRGKIDIDLAAINGNSAAFRLSENEPHMEAMSQEMAETLFYGDTDSAPEKFLGLAPRYSDKAAGNGQNILDAGGTGDDNASIWLVCWGKKSAFGMFPRGTNAGIKHKVIQDNTGDGATDVEDDDGRSYRAYVDEYSWNAGMCLKDWRYVVRIANIDISDLLALSSTQLVTAQTFVLKLMKRALDRVPNLMGVKPVFYMNRTLQSLIGVGAMEKQINVLTIEQGLNSFTEKFLGVPVRKCDALLNSEGRVT